MQQIIADRIQACLAEAAIARHLPANTRKTYIRWTHRFVLFHRKRHPRNMGVAEVNAFLTHLPVESHVSASTQNQALSALLFLYGRVLETRGPMCGSLGLPYGLRYAWRVGAVIEWQVPHATGGWS